MESQTTNQDRPRSSAQPGRVPQLSVRAGVRSGQDIQGCADNVQYWQEQYQLWYDVARRRGYI